MRKVGGAPGHQVLLGEGVDLSSIELWSEDRELVGGDVEIVLVDAEGRLTDETAKGLIKQLVESLQAWTLRLKAKA